MRKHGKFREKGTNFVTGNLEEQNPNAERAARSTKVSLRKVGTREEKGMGAWAAPREDELGKVRYKPEELGLYIHDPHATLKPEQQRYQLQEALKISHPDRAAFFNVLIFPYLSPEIFDFLSSTKSLFESSFLKSAASIAATS